MANIYDVEGIEEFLPEQKKPLSSFLGDYATTANEVAAPYIGMAGKYGFGNDPAKIQGLGSDVRHTTGSALGKFGIQDYFSQFGLQPSNPISNFLGNAGIAGSTVAQEISDAIRGFRQAGLEGAINQPMEDVKANFRAMGIPYGTSLEDIVNMSVEGSPSAYMANAPEEIKISRFNAPGPFNYGAAQASEVTPQNEPMDIEDFLGTSTPQDLGFIGNAPGIKEAVAPVGITDRGRGMPGAPTGAYEMLGGTPVAIGDVLGRQQALEKADFYEEPSKRGIDLGLLGLLAGPAGFLTGSNALRGIGLAANIASGRAGRAVDAVSRGLGSLGTKVSGKMRGINPTTGKPNTQAQYEANRTARQQQNRTDRMIDRIAAGKKTRSNPRDAGTTKAQKDAISAAIQDSYRGGGGGGSSGGGKIVCTMMNERYGFGSFRNKIWMKFHENHGPEYQKGYHAIFLPLVKIAKGEGKINTAVRKVLEHMGRHVTADMFKIMKGKKRDTLGRIYRAIFEPACHIIGKIKSALGRG